VHAFTILHFAPIIITVTAYLFGHWHHQDQVLSPLSHTRSLWILPALSTLVDMLCEILNIECALQCLPAQFASVQKLNCHTSRVGPGPNIRLGPLFRVRLCSS
jgi:hypothetical protein